MQREIKKKTQLYALVAVLSAIVLGVICYNFGIEVVKFQPSIKETPFKTFASDEELKSFLLANLPIPYQTGSWENFAMPEPWVENFTRVENFARTSPSTFSPSPSTQVGAVVYEPVNKYSTTNIQVEGVDEADIVKTEGEYMYVVSGNRVIILKAYPPEEAEILSQINFNGTLKEIFINGNKLVALGGPVSDFYIMPASIDITIVPVYPSTLEFTPNGTITVVSPIPVSIDVHPLKVYLDGETFVNVYDVSNKTNPILTRNFTITGSYFDSRRIDEYVYVVINQPAQLDNDTVILPKIYSEDGIQEVSASQIYYSNVSDYAYTFTTIVAINMQNDEQPETRKTLLLGEASCMYVSLNNIYITFPKNEKTLVSRGHIGNGEIEFPAYGEVLGSVLNQFSMDEYGNYFRIATTTWINATSQNNIYALDMNLSTVGRLENLASGETIYSTRFMGDRCYLVTFRQVDPFFVIDLKDPSNPAVLGWLKIPGFSRYLHPYDQDHVIGIGQETGKVKISLFDVSNASDPQEIDKEIVGVDGEWSDSFVLEDHKALLFDKSKNLLVIPISISGTGSVWQGAYVFNISLPEGLVLKGNVTHLENGIEPWETGYWVKRSLYIDDVLYTISGKKIKMTNLENLELMKEIALS